MKPLKVKVPKIHDAQALCERYGLRQVIVLFIADDAGSYGYASYGQTTRECKRARALADRLFQQMASLGESV